MSCTESVDVEFFGPEAHRENQGEEDGEDQVQGDDHPSPDVLVDALDAAHPPGAPVEEEGELVVDQDDLEHGRDGRGLHRQAEPVARPEAEAHGQDHRHGAGGEEHVVGAHERHHLVDQGAVGVRHQVLVGDDAAVGRQNQQVDGAGHQGVGQLLSALRRPLGAAGGEEVGAVPVDVGAGAGAGGGVLQGAV